tara:strand:- start:284 stop:547 length:264 start_codon:yes stop_codon:yes gene_type:complete
MSESPLIILIEEIDISLGLDVLEKTLISLKTLILSFFISLIVRPNSLRRWEPVTIKFVEIFFSFFKELINPFKRPYSALEPDIKKKF